MNLSSLSLIVVVFNLVASIFSLWDNFSRGYLILSEKWNLFIIRIGGEGIEIDVSF